MSDPLLQAEAAVRGAVAFCLKHRPVRVVIEITSDRNGVIRIDPTVQSAPLAVLIDKCETIRG